MGGGLSNRVALVTGGGKGIGAAVALRLSVEGARVAVMGRDHAAVDGIARGDQRARARGRRHGPGRRRRGAAAPSRALGRRLDPRAECRHRAERVARGHDGRRMGAHLRRERDGAVPPGPRRRPRDDEDRLGSRRPRRVERRAHGLRVHGGVLRLEARARRVDARARRRARPHRRHGQRRVPRLRGHGHVRAAIARIAEKTGRTPTKRRAELEAINPQRRLVHVDEVAQVVAMLCPTRHAPSTARPSPSTAAR